MKTFLNDIPGSGYTFNAAAKTVTLTGLTTLTLDKILGIVNTTRGIVLYNPTAAATGGTIAANVVTLTYNTAAQNNADALMILVDYGTLPITATLTTGDIEIGAVELKNSDTDARANILPANTARTTGTIVLATQSIDAAGAVLSTSALATSAKQDTQITLATPANTITDASGSITAGGTAQQVMAANAARRWFFFQNNSDTDCWLNFGVVAVAYQPSIKVSAGASYENPPHFCPRGIVSVFGATTAKTFTAKEGA